jgi:hypothetical protein
VNCARHWLPWPPSLEEQGGIRGLRSAISDAASWDDQVSEGQLLSEREAAVLQVLDLMTRHTTQLVWIKSALLRDKVMSLMGNAVDKTGDTQWIGHVLKRLHLIDEARRKRQTDGIACAVHPLEIIDMMRRYNVATISPDKTKTFITVQTLHAERAYYERPVGSCRVFRSKDISHHYF